MNEKEEMELVDTFKMGEKAAFETVFDRYSAEIHGFAQSIVGNNNATAEDISMESFSKLFKKCLNFHSLPNIRAFLYVVTRNACLDYLRSSMRKGILIKNWAHTIESQDFIEIIQVEGELFDALKVAVEQLPEGCREIIKLIYFEGLKTSEIASRLSIEPATVRSQKRFGINKLKEMFGEKKIIIYLLLLFGSNLFAGIGTQNFQ